MSKENSDSDSDSDRLESGATDAARTSSPVEPETRYDVKVDAHETAATRARHDTPRVLDEISRKSGGAAAGSAPAGRTGRTRSERRTGLKLFTLLLFLYTLGATGFLAWQQQLLQENLAGVNQRNSDLNDDLDIEVASLNTTLAELRSRVEEAEGQTLTGPDSPAVESPSLDSPDPSSPAADTPALDAPAPNSPDQASIATTAAAPEATSVNSLRERQEALIAEIATLRDTLTGLANEEGRAGAPPDFSWKVFEAEYLTRFADQKLSVEADYDAAIALLQRADEALADSGKSDVSTARSALSADIALLRGIEQPDSQELYRQLESLAGAVQELDMQAAMRARYAALREQQAEPLIDSAAQPGPLGATVDFLGEVFIWRKWQDRPEATLAPGEVLLVRQSLELAIRQAQVGLVNRDPLRYREGLEEARSILEEYRLSEARGGEAVLREIDALLTLDIAPQPPSLQSSLDEVGQVAASER